VSWEQHPEAGFSHLDDPIEFGRFPAEDLDQLLQYRDQAFVAVDQRDLYSCRISIVGRLAQVYMVIGMAMFVLPFLESSISKALLAITSLAFMFVEVPAPPCIIST
jgi:hypothetical protein